MDAQMEKDFIKGGAFLIENRTPGEVFTPEDFTDEHRMIGETCREYIEKEVVPNLPALERHEWNVAKSLLKNVPRIDTLTPKKPSSTVSNQAPSTRKSGKS